MSQCSDVRLSASAASLVLLLQGAGTEAAPPSGAGLPASVGQHVKDLNYWCSRSGGIPSKSPGLIRIVDLTGDGRPDYVIDTGRYQCLKAVTFMYGGHDGSPVSIFVNGPKRTAHLAYEGHSQSGVEIRKRGGRFQAWMTVGALLCGQPPGSAKSFADWWLCSRPLEWSALTKRFIFAPLSQAKRIERR
jgi:hypothetical protein